MTQFKRVFCLTLVGLTLTASVAAQETAPQEPTNQIEASSDAEPQASTSVATAESEGASPSELSLSIAALATCKAEKSEVVRALAMRAQNGCNPLKDKLAETRKKVLLCKDDFQQVRRSNIKLNDRLTKCTAFSDETGEDPILKKLRVDISRLEAEIAARNEALAEEASLRLEANARIVKLEDRLRKFDISIDPGFSYATDSVRKSLASAAQLPTLKQEFPRLPAELCAEGIDWLLSQSAEDKALLRAIWVWNNGIAMRCARDRQGKLIVIKPNNNSDRAHIVLFK